jgi:arsenite methyltransferase
MSSDKTSDLWADWLLKHRHGDNADCQRIVMDGMKVVRDKVLENANIKEGETLLDVGTGDGLIGFGALDKVGANGKVIFSDISQSLLDVCRDYSTEAGVFDRCEFINADAIDLSSIRDASVGVVSTRSVLIYVKEKQRAFHEFFRVLKPGGRVSIFEPIGKLGFEFVPKGDHYLGYNIVPIKDLWEKIKASRKEQYDAQSTMSDFDERDLIKMLQRAGFSHIHLDLDVTVGNSGIYPGNWDAFYNSAPNPLVPTLREQVEAALTADEQDRFIAHLKPLVGTNTGRIAQCLAFVWAEK